MAEDDKDIDDLDDFDDDEDIFSEDELEDDGEKIFEAAEFEGEGPGYRDSIVDKLKSYTVPLVVGGVVLGYVVWKLLGFIISEPEPTHPPIATVPSATEKQAIPIPGKTGEIQKSLEARGVIPPKPQDIDPTKGQFGELFDETTGQIDELTKIDPGIGQTQPLETLTRDVFGDPTKDEISASQEFQDVVNDALSRVETKAQENNKKIHEVSDSVEIIGKQVGNVNNSLSKLRQQLKSLEGVLSKLSSDINTIKQSQLQTKKKKVQADKMAKDKQRQALIALSSEFHVEAVIPGRAWLTDGEGSSITVTEGDTIERLGKVIAIDAQKSAVVMSTGIVIR